MIAIKGLNMPIDCKKCPLMGTDGDPTRDILSPMMCIAIWATTHETKHCVSGKIRDDCPLVETEERKTGKWLMPDKFYDKNIWRKCSQCNTHFELFSKYVAMNGRAHYIKTEANYCKICGAKMEGEEE